MFSEGVLPTPGGPTKQSTGPRLLGDACTARYSTMRSLIAAVVILVGIFHGFLEVETLFALFVPGSPDQSIVAHDGRFGARLVHHLELLELF
jgi:hypothetical protein